jgi:hypothetical protein
MLRTIMLSMILISIIGGSMTLLSSSLFKQISVIKQEMYISNILIALKSSVKYYNNEPKVPFGQNTSNHHELPSWLKVRKEINGANVIYCPYGKSTNATYNNVVTLDSSTDYNVNTMTIDGVDYVDYSESPSISGLAFAVIIPTSSIYNPVCTDITESNGEYSLTGSSDGKGVVYGVSFYELGLLNDSEQYHAILSTTNDVTSVLSVVEQEKWKSHRFSFETSNAYQLSNDLMFTGDFKNKTVEIIGNGSLLTGTQPVTISCKNKKIKISNMSFASNINLYLNNCDIEMKNVTFGGKISSETSYMSIENTTLGNNTDDVTPLSLSNSQLVIINSGQINTSGDYGILLKGNSTLFMQNNTTLNMNGGVNGANGLSPIGLYINDSRVTLEDSVVNFTGVFDALIGNQFGGLLSLRSSNLNSSASNIGIYNKGRLSMNFATLAFDSGVSIALYNDKGAMLDTTNSIVSSASSTHPATGIKDNYSTILSGELTVYATTCYDGGRFVLNDNGHDEIVIDQYVNQSTGSYENASRTVKIDADDAFNKLNLTCY